MGRSLKAESCHADVYLKSSEPLIALPNPAGVVLDRMPTTGSNTAPMKAGSADGRTLGHVRRLWTASARYRPRLRPSVSVRSKDDLPMAVVPDRQKSFTVFRLAPRTEVRAIKVRGLGSATCGRRVIITNLPHIP